MNSFEANKTFVLSEDIDLEEVKNKIMSYADKMMLVKVASAIEEDSLCRYYDSQVTYRGSVEFDSTLEGVVAKTINATNSVYMLPRMMNGAACIKNDTFITDAFSPIRENFIV